MKQAVATMAEASTGQNILKWEKKHNSIPHTIQIMSEVVKTQSVSETILSHQLLKAHSVRIPLSLFLGLA